MNIDRREFIGGACAAAAMPLTGLGAAKPTDKMIWSALLHLGGNMWDDYPGDFDALPKSREEELKRPNPVGPGGKRRSFCRGYVRAIDKVWKHTVDHAAEKKLNLVFVDCGEAVAYPSHPELAVPGTWSVEKVCAELKRMRKLGLEPVPKCNFSTTHDVWLKDYHRMVSTKKYYQVVADIIKDVCEIFDHPRYFHLGMDEETTKMQFNHYHKCARSGELFWHDLYYMFDKVERQGARAVTFSDMMAYSYDEYLKRMPKSVLQSNWYYKMDYSEKAMTWDPKKPDLAALFTGLEKAGFDQLPCLSNISEPASVSIGVNTLTKVIDPDRLKGFCVAPWGMSFPDHWDIFDDGGKWLYETRTINGLDALADARDALE